MRKYLCNKIGAGHVDTAIKIIIGVVIGALIIGGLYLLFAGDRGVVDQLDTEIVAMMEYRGPGYRLERAYNKKTETFYLRYSYDGKTWCMLWCRTACQPSGGRAGGDRENAKHTSQRLLHRGKRH